MSFGNLISNLTMLRDVTLALNFEFHTDSYYYFFLIRLVRVNNVLSKHQRYADIELLHLEPGSSFSVIGSSRSSIFHYIHTPCPFLG